VSGSLGVSRRGAVYVALHDALDGPGRLLRRDTNGVESTLFRSDAALLVVGADALHVYVIERRTGLGQLLAVEKTDGRVTSAFVANHPGEFVLGPRVAVDTRAVWLTELDTRGDSDRGTLWRIPVPRGTPTARYSGRLVSQPALAGGYLYFVETEKLTGASRMVRLPADGA
jgi:hypothetical protein